MLNDPKRNSNIYPASSPVIEGHLPTEIRRKPAKADILFNNFRTALINLSADMLSVKITNDTEDSMPDFREFAMSLMKIIHQLSNYEDVKKAPLPILQVLFRTIEESLTDPKTKDKDLALKSIRTVNAELNELIKLLSKDKPVVKEFRIGIIGSKQDVGSLSKDLRQLALNLIRDAQKNAADDHRWETVKGVDGEIKRFVAPLGSGKEPVRPPADPDLIDTLRELTERLYKAAKIPFASLPTI